MPHTENILPGGRYAVVSCHVERPLDDEVWELFAALQARPPGGFRIAALMRPPDTAAGEDEILWLGRARAAAENGRLEAREPCYVQLPSGRSLLEVPTTHSIGMLARGLLAPYRGQIVHAYFHDTDLLDAKRRTALSLGLTFLGMKRWQTDLEQVQRGLRPAKTMSFANSGP